MKTPKKSLTRKQARLFRSLIATAFIANGFFPFVAPAFAEGTKAGIGISNTATATYEDPGKPGTTINATSNEVIVNVAEVAGINITTTGVPIDDTPATPISVGDILTYTFTIKNVGNDPTRFRIPNLALTTGPGIVSGNLEYFGTDTNTPGAITPTTPIWREITGTEKLTDSVVVDGTVPVRVKVKVQPGAQANDIITVQLGDTPGNAQNVLRSNDGGDVYTVDNSDPSTITNEILGVPANGTREASAKQQSTVGASPKNLALATLLKTRTIYDNKSTTDSILDDEVTYDLKLRVESNDVFYLPMQPIYLLASLMVLLIQLMMALTQLTITLV